MTYSGPGHFDRLGQDAQTACSVSLASVTACGGRLIGTTFPRIGVIPSTKRRIRRAHCVGETSRNKATTSTRHGVNATSTPNAPSSPMSMPHWEQQPGRESTSLAIAKPYALTVYDVGHPTYEGSPSHAGTNPPASLRAGAGLRIGPTNSAVRGVGLNRPHHQFHRIVTKAVRYELPLDSVLDVPRRFKGCGGPTPVRHVHKQQNGLAKVVCRWGLHRSSSLAAGAI